MRCVYVDGYKMLFEKHGNVVAWLADTLTRQSDHFYGQTVCGHAISDIAYPPNPIIIEDIVLNTMSDIERLVEYHQVVKPNRYKYAAYTGFWWMRGKPFLCKLDRNSSADKLADPLFRDLCTSLNEVFITDFMLSMLQNQRLPEGKENTDDGYISYMAIKDSLQYFLKYRHYSAQALELFLKGIDASSGYLIPRDTNPRLPLQSDP